MQKSLYVLCLVIFSACHSTVESPIDKDSAAAINMTGEPAIDTGIMTLSSPPEHVQIIPDTVWVEGYFDVGMKRDTAYGVFFGKTGIAREDAEDGESGIEMQYVVRFADPKIKPMPVVNGRHIRLVNEGDLNGDGQDEISIFAQSMHSCVFTTSTWSYLEGRWRRITDYWHVPTTCNYMSDEELESRIVQEDGVIYYYETDMSDKDFPLVKKELTLLKP
jgi:hypothetical protein